jgi:coproporphyrinogen III oxidase-like Fe-S oxidoreductase
VELIKACGCNQTTFYPLMASPESAESLASAVGRIDYSREGDYHHVIGDVLCEGGAFEASSAWTYSREKGGMIDEYIVDTPEYVGIGSGAQSFLDGRLYGNTFSLSEYAEAIGSGRMSVATAGRTYGWRDKMRYQFVVDLFGLRLDKHRFKEQFGVPVDLGLLGEMVFMRAVGAFDRDDAECLTLTPKGRYLLVVMMREMLAMSNQHRDEARAALPAEERLLLLEGCDLEGTLDPDCVAAAV